MPVVAIVEGVKIVFYANEHPPARFRALIAEHRAVVDIANVKFTAGSPPRTQSAPQCSPGLPAAKASSSNASPSPSPTKRWSRSNEETSSHRRC